MATLQEHKALLWLVAGFAATCYALRLVTGYESLQPIDRLTVEIWLRHTIVGLGVPLGYHLIHFHVGFLIGLIREREAYEDTLSRRFREYVHARITLFRVAGTLLVAATLSVLETTFWAFKRSITLFNPLSWDRTFERLDALVHLGHAPWTLLQPFFGTPMATVVLDKLYYLWFPLILLIVAWQAWNGDRQARMHFLLAYAVAWMVAGTGMATAFSSGGPCYYGVLTPGPDPYATQMAFLYGVDAQVPVLALRVQEWLWGGYIGLNAFQGISAMPSMHLVLPVLWALASFKVNRWLGLFFVLYTIVILIGSVHLAWHYAIDGYVSILVVLIIWPLVGRFVRRFPPTPAPAREPYLPRRAKVGAPPREAENSQTE